MSVCVCTRACVSCRACVCPSVGVCWWDTSGDVHYLLASAAQPVADDPCADPSGDTYALTVFACASRAPACASPTYSWRVMPTKQTVARRSMAQSGISHSMSRSIPDSRELAMAPVSMGMKRIDT